MSSKPKIKTTKSTKRYTFQSFRERVDSLKIEPSKKLNTRAFDDVDESHFLSSLQRWREFNRSGSFAEFADTVEGYSQSLPQILHYKSKIYDLLHLYISKHDALSLQPLLELLTQFCHDLGPDFMVFYTTTIELITELALGENDSNTLEWEFNSLAFIFKYLSKILSQDLIPTFKLLEPLMKSKDHIARFSAEALSFLIRKSKPDELVNFTNFAFDQLEDVNYNKSIVILFSEAVKSTQGSIHSKHTIIISSLLERVNTPESSSALTDILLSIIGYTSNEVGSLYDLVLNKSLQLIESNPNFFDHYVKILIALVFADSGKKVPNWDAIITAIRYIIDNYPADKLNEESKTYITYLFALLSRNCEVQVLTKSHTILFRYLLTFQKHFLPFIISITELTKERAIRFSTIFVQEFINKNWKSNTEAIGYFIQDLHNRDLISKSDNASKFKITVPQTLCGFVYEDLSKINVDSSDSLYEVYWRLLVISTSDTHREGVLTELFQKITSFKEDSKLRSTLLAKIVSVLVSCKSEAVYGIITENFNYLYTELDFITGFTKFLKYSNQSIEASKSFISFVSNNLFTADHDLRFESLQLISALSKDDELSHISNQCAIIEQIPLVLANGRDIGIRVRAFATHMRNLDTLNDLRSEVFFKFLFGQLTVKFSPTWEVILEVLPTVFHKNEELVWELCFKFINGFENNQGFHSVIGDAIEEVKPSWNIIEHRLNTIIDNIASTLSIYFNFKDSLLHDAEERNRTKSYPEFICANAVKVLKSIPSIAEKHSESLSALVLDDDEDEEVTKLSNKDRNSVFELFALFKKMNTIPRTTELKAKFFSLLSSKTPEIRKVALNCLLNYHMKGVNKYKDNLTNLLDDSTYRDGLSKLFSKSEDSVIEDKDADAVMPLVLRILFGRAQTSSSSGNKKGLKSSSISVLVNMDPKYIEQFLKIVAEKIYDYDDEIIDFTEIKGNQIALTTLRRSLGYANLLTDIINTMGEKFTNVLTLTIRPLLLTLVYAQKSIESKSEDTQLNTVARNVRQSGMKDLLLLFDLLREHSWDEYIEPIYELVLAPRFELFEVENLQQASSLLKLIVVWSEYKPYHELLLINDLEPAHKILSLLFDVNSKPQVLSNVIDFAKNIVSLVSKKGKYQQLQTLVSGKVFDSLPAILSRTSDQLINSKSIDLLLALVENRQVQDQGKRLVLVNLATQLLEKPASQLSKESKLQVLETLKVLIREFEGGFDGIKHLYDVSSKFLKLFSDRKQRELLVQLFKEIGEKFADYSKVGSYIDDLNAFSKRGIAEFDYERRLAAYREINDTTFSGLSITEWLPVLNNALYFVNDENDLSIRTSASYTLRRFIDALSSKEEADKEFIHIFKDLVLPSLRVGLRHKEEVVQTEYINLLAHIVSNIRYVDDFKDMEPLLFNGDEEANFFLNINHIQLHRRQRAMRRLAEMAVNIEGSNVAHYLLPIIERYAYCTDEKLHNITSEAVSTIEELIKSVSYRQFQAIFKRYLAGLKEGSATLRYSVSLIVNISSALLNNVRLMKEEGSQVMKGFPTDPELLDVQIENEMITPVTKILNKRNEETSVMRSPLIEALASLISCLSHERVVFILPGILTNICQIMRSRFDDLRDATRKYLGKASNILGAKYIKFIISELKTALARGFQVHVLGFTVNSVLLATELKHGDLDDSAALIMDLVMENIFGSTGQEKDADGYRTTMKEVKNNKSFDTAELLGKLISLSQFNDVVTPIKMLLKERITLKIQNKLDELLRRFALGIHKNIELKDQVMLVLCYELFAESERDLSVAFKKQVDASQEHFLVKLDAKPLKVETENSTYIDTFQKFSLELLRTALHKNEGFISKEHLTGFLPVFEKAMKSENEAVIISVLKIMSMIMNVEFDTERDIFKTCARRCLSIIKNFPSTESDLVQACFKYLSTIIRHREDLTLKENSIGYLLVRIQPDLQDQAKQGLAFNFLKAVVSKRVVIPEVYDTMDKVREIMVTSHSKERRDMSRSIYFHFVMEYDQGRGRLEKQFKFLVDNLGYPAEAGKQSVMELVHLILNKSGKQLLEAVSSSFFVALAKVLISDTASKTREMAIALITTIFEKLGAENYDKYIIGWLNSKNSALLKCSLQLYRIRLRVTGITEGEVDEEVLVNIKELLQLARSDSEIEVSWELVYIALNCLQVVSEKNHELIDSDLKNDIIQSLLYPHSWIRLASSRLIGSLMVKEDVFDDLDIQNVANRIFHQLRAPSIEESLGSQAVKFLTLAFMKWENKQILFDSSKGQEEEEEEEVAKGEEEIGEDIKETKKDIKIADWAINKASVLIRSEKSTNIAQKSGIQFLAMTIQILSLERILEMSQDLLLPLFNLTESDYDANDEKKELQNLALEAMKMLEDKIGVSEYTQAYSKVRQFVLQRRQERRTKRARLAVTAPEVIARRKNRKHERTREKRKHEKDENGFYHSKKKQPRR